MKWNIDLEIADGYRMVKEEREMDIMTAGAWMRSRRQHRWTSGRREGTRAILTRHGVLCPCCGHQVPAYARFLGVGEAENRLPRPRVDRWATAQMTMYEMGERELVFNRVQYPRDSFFCPRCGEESGHCTRVERLHIRCRDGEISATLDDVGLEELLAMPGEEEVSLCPPLYQTVSFYPEQGRAFLRIAGQDGGVLADRELTHDPACWRGSRLYQVLSRSDLARRKLLSAFAEGWGGPLPFGREAPPEALVSMTAFCGFSRAFYDAIPYDVERGGLDRSFAAVAERLHRAADLPAIYDASALPGAKTARRLFFTRQGLFFYLREAELLWEALGDANVFRRVMSLGHIYEILSFFHRYPGSGVFLRDYRAVKGAKGLADGLEHRWSSVQEYALRYGAMDPVGREGQRMSWKSGGIPARDGAGCSIPIGKDGGIRDCTVDGYRFTLLRTGQDFHLAGKALNNCLGSWRAYDNPVVLIRKGAACKGAVELKGNRVVQARIRDNGPIEDDAELDRAFRKWAGRQKLTIDPPVYEDDEVEYYF